MCHLRTVQTFLHSGRSKRMCACSLIRLRSVVNMSGSSSGLQSALYMIIAVVFYSAVPIFFQLGNSDESPFLFTGIYLVSIGVGMGAVVLPIKRKLLFQPTVIEDIKSHCKSWLMLVSVSGVGGLALFACGLEFLEISIAAILYETWPLLLILAMSFLFKGTQRYRAISVGTVVFVSLALCGATLVILSHNDTPQPLLEIRNTFTGIGTLFGIFLVLMSAVGQATFGAGTLKIGVLLAEKHSRPESRKMGEIVFVMVITLISMFIAGGVLCAIGLIASENISSHQLIYAIIGGLFVNSIGAVAFRAANLTTDDLGVNAISFLTPLATLIWLWLLSILHVPHIDYLIIGAMCIVAANLLINAEASKRDAYKALVVSLLTFGTFIYFTDGAATRVPLELPVTIFILILAFRVDRLARRTNQEEEWVFEAFHRLKSLAYRKHIPNRAWMLMLDIDRHKNPEGLTIAYKELVGLHLTTCFKRSGVDEKRIAELTDIRQLVDKLVHSRQQGANFGEKVAIALAGMLIVTGLLFFNGVQEFYSEFASFLLSSVVVFLFFNILDLEKDRRDSILEEVEAGDEYAGQHIVKFDDIKSRAGQQTISVVTSAVIVVVFARLFIGS